MTVRPSINTPFILIAPFPDKSGSGAKVVDNNKVIKNTTSLRQPGCHGEFFRFRPVALRLRLSADLPLSDSVV